MKKVTGIGGVFFKSKDVAAIKDWYRDNLGFGITQWGAPMRWGDLEKNNDLGHTEWSPFKEDSDYYAPSTLPFMINYRVDDLKALIDILRSEGVNVVGGIDSYEYGHFAWIMDPEARKIELWQAIDGGFGEPSPIWADKVLGLAGIFLRSGDPAMIKDWYKKHLDINDRFRIRDLTTNKETDITWTVVDTNDPLFADIDKPYVYSYRVRDLKSLTKTLPITKTSENSGWIIDPEGNKVVLRE